MNIKLLTTIFVAGMTVSNYAKELTSKDKELYVKDKSFSDVCFAPDKASTKVISKHCFSVPYKGLLPDLPTSYQKTLPSYFAQVKSEGDNIKNVLLTYSLKDKDLINKFNALLPDSNIIVYGTLRHKRGRTKEKKMLYYFEIEDLREYDPVDELMVTSFNSDDYKQVFTKELDIYFTRYLDQKIKLPIHIKSISNHLNAAYSKIGGITLEDFFVLKVAEPLTVDILVSRESDAVKKIISADTETALFLCGRLLKLEDPTSKRFRTMYYFMLDGIIDREETTVEKDKYLQETERLKN